MIIRLIKKNTGKDLIQIFIKKYNTKDELEQKYNLTSDPLLYLDLEDWNYFEQHPNEIQTKAKTLLVKSLDLDKTDFKILSLLKRDNITIKSLSNKLNEDINIIKPHLKNSKKKD